MADFPGEALQKEVATGVAENWVRLNPKGVGDEATRQQAMQSAVSAWVETDPASAGA